MSPKRILSVGQCGADHAAISWTVKAHFDAEVVPADSALAALSALRDHDIDLVLVNRVFDADGSSGLDLIKQIKNDTSLQSTPVMLVSNFDDAQREAVQAGAAPGFGKAALREAPTISKLQKFLG